MRLIYLSPALHTEELVELDLWTSPSDPTTLFAGPTGSVPDAGLDPEAGAWRERSAVTPGRYQHHKGKHYRVLGLAYRQATQERLVAYEALYELRYRYFLRPELMFLDVVRDEVTRFTKI